MLMSEVLLYRGGLRPHGYAFPTSAQGKTALATKPIEGRNSSTKCISDALWRSQFFQGRAGFVHFEAADCPGSETRQMMTAFSKNPELTLTFSISEQSGL